MTNLYTRLITVISNNRQACTMYVETNWSKMTKNKRKKKCHAMLVGIVIKRMQECKTKSYTVNFKADVRALPPIRSSDGR